MVTVHLLFAARKMLRRAACRADLDSTKRFSFQTSVNICTDVFPDMLMKLSRLFRCIGHRSNSSLFPAFSFEWTNGSATEQRSLVGNTVM